MWHKRKGRTRNLCHEGLDNNTYDNLYIEDSDSDEVPSNLQFANLPLNITTYSSDDEPTSSVNSSVTTTPSCMRSIKRTQLPIATTKRKCSRVEKGIVETNQPVYHSIPERSRTNFLAQESIDAFEYAETLIEEYSSSDTETPKAAQNSTTITTSGLTQCTPPSELDMFLSLIERECGANVTKPNLVESRRKKSKDSFTKGGYVENLLQTLQSASADTKYLEHDKRFGLQAGVALDVLDVHVEFGVHFAKVRELIPRPSKQHECANSIETQFVSSQEQSFGVTGSYYVVLSNSIAHTVKVGSKLEAFFNNDTSHMYSIRDADGKEQLCSLMPHRLLLN